MRPKWLNDARDLVVPPPGGDISQLIFDIETSPEANWTWGRYQQNTLYNLRPQYLLCFGYTWAGSGEYHFVGQQQDPSYKPDHPYRAPNPRQDRWVVAQLWHLFDMADILIAHNGDKFDIPFQGGRQMHYDIEPPSPSATIDTLKIVRRHARFTSNKLNDLGHHLLNETKQATHGIHSWFDAMFDAPGGWDHMERYNVQDVVLLEKLYDLVTPYVTRPVRLSLPNRNQWMNDRPPVCPNPACKRPDAGLISRGKRTRKSGLTYRQWQCKECRAYCQSNYAERSMTPASDRVS